MKKAWSGNIPVAILAAAVALPSLGIAYKFGRHKGVGFELGFAYVGTLVVVRWGYARFQLRVSGRWASYLMLGTLVLLTVGLVIIYPLNQAHAFGPGNDEADGMNVAVTNLLHARYVYAGHTWAGNSIVPWPGSILLAVPFVLIGNSAYQVVFWLGVLYVVLAWYLDGNATAALGVIWMVLALSPVVLDYFWSGSDVLAAAMFVTAFSLVVVKTAEDRSRWHILAAAGLGLALSSRANFIFVYPAVLLYLWRARDGRFAAVSVGVTGASFAFVTLPPWIADPLHFTPLTSRLDILAGLGAYADLIIAATTLVTVLVVLVAGRRWDWLLNAALLLAVPVFGLVALALRAFGLAGLRSYPDYGVIYVFYAALVGWRLALGVQHRHLRHAGVAPLLSGATSQKGRP